jgi:very-short-patch-repair endonuclease
VERYEPKLKQPSRQLRNKSTDAEILLWAKIRMRQLNGFLFYRQKPLGGYIADFYCPKAKLVIEVDGGQHLTPDSVEYDRVRDEYMKNIGLKTLRFTNIDVIENIDGVVETIEKSLSLTLR